MMPSSPAYNTTGFKVDSTWMENEKMHQLQHLRQEQFIDVFYIIDARLSYKASVLYE